jgi:Na+/glutamate symporter
MTEKSLMDLTQTGWFIAIAAATWGVILRVMVGRREASSKRQEGRLQKLEDSVSAIRIDIAEIAGVLKERDRNGRHTWPRGHK